MSAERITIYYISVSWIHYLDNDKLKDKEEETYKLKINLDS